MHYRFFHRVRSVIITCVMCGTELFAVMSDNREEVMSREMLQATMRHLCPFVIDVRKNPQMGENAVTLAWFEVPEDNTTVCWLLSSEISM